MAVGARRDITHGLAVFHDQFVTDDLRVGVSDLHHHEFPLRAVFAFSQGRRAADEIGLGKIDEAIEPCFGSRIIGSKILVERAVALLQPQRGKRASAEMRKAEIAPGVPEVVIQRREIVRRRPYLIAEFAGEARARQNRGGESHRGLHHLKQPEGGAREVGARHELKEFARLRPRDRYAAERRGLGSHEDVRRRVRLPEPAHVELLGKAGADDHEAIVREAGDREVADDAAGGVEHRRQREPSRFRDLAGKDAVEPASRAAPGHLVFAIVGRLVESDGRANRPAFSLDDREGFGAAVGRRFPSLDAVGGEPQGMLEAEIRAHHRARCDQLVIDRRAADGPGRGELLVGIGEAEAARIVFGNLERSIFRRRESAETRDVHREDVLAGIVVSHPARKHEADAAALAETGHDRAGDPEIPQAAQRTHQRIAVRREREWPVDRLLDPDTAQRGEMLEADLEVRRQSLDIVGQQLHRKIIGRLYRRPNVSVGFIDAHQNAPALLAHIDFAGIIRGVDDFARQARQFRDRLGDEVMMLHRQHRQFGAHHMADLARPQSRAIDDMLGVNRALVGRNVPGTVAARMKPENPGEALDRSAELAGGGDVGMRRARGVAMSAVRPPERADEITGVDQRIEALRLLERDHLGFHPEIARARTDELQTVEFARGRREHQSAVGMQPARLAR